MQNFLVLMCAFGIAMLLHEADKQQQQAQALCELNGHSRDVCFQVLNR